MFPSREHFLPRSRFSLEMGIFQNRPVFFNRPFIFPFMFIGIALGWKYEKLGGYLVTVPLAAGLLFTVVTEGELITHMLVPFLAGIGYLVVGYTEAAE
jgi:hypothetical protein